MTSASDTSTTRRVAVLVAREGIEQSELTGPWQALQDAGWQPVLVAPDEGEVQAFNHLDAADTFPVDVTLSTASGQRSRSCDLRARARIRTTATGVHPAITAKHSAIAGTHFSWSPSNSTMASLSPSRRRSWWSEASKQTRKQGPWQLTTLLVQKFP